MQARGAAAGGRGALGAGRRRRAHRGARSLPLARPGRLCRLLLLHARPKWVLAGTEEVDLAKSGTRRYQQSSQSSRHAVHSATQCSMAGAGAHASWAHPHRRLSAVQPLRSRQAASTAADCESAAGLSPAACTSVGRAPPAQSTTAGQPAARCCRCRGRRRCCRPPRRRLLCWADQTRTRSRSAAQGNTGTGESELFMVNPQELTQDCQPAASAAWPKHGSLVLRAGRQRRQRGGTAHLVCC